MYNTTFNLYSSDSPGAYNFGNIILGLKLIIYNYLAHIVDGK